jgi:microcystin degradation protein MlrC
MAPRVGLVALLASVDSFAPPAATQADILTGPRFDRAIDGGDRRLADLATFATTMSATGPWQRVPIAGFIAPPSGPRDVGEIARLTDVLCQAIDGARPLDAVAVALGGPIATLEDDDVIGTLLASLRTSVGPGVAILVLARSTTQLSDVAFRTIDVALPAATAASGGGSDSGRRLALLFRLMQAKALVPRMHHVRLPLLWARTGDAIVRFDELSATLAHQAAASGLLAAGITGGVPWLDAVTQGLIVIGLGEDRDAVRRFTLDAADHVWQRRADGIGAFVSTPDAVAAALDPTRPPTLFIDSGDRIDLGSSGHGTDLLAAFAWSGVQEVLAFGHVDPGVVEAATRAGVGATIFVAFNRAAGGDLFEVEAQVLALDDVQRAAALVFGGVTAVVSEAVIAAEEVPRLLDRLGVVPPRMTIAKFVPPSVMFGEGAIWPAQRLDVQTFGDMSPAPERRTYSRVVRPIYPLDPDTEWPPTDEATDGE